MLVRFQPELPDLRRGDGIWHTYLAQTQGLASSLSIAGSNAQHRFGDGPLGRGAGMHCVISHPAPLSLVNSYLLPVFH